MKDFQATDIENKQFITFIRTLNCVCEEMTVPPRNVSFTNNFELTCGEIEVIKTMREYNGKTRSYNDVIEGLLIKGILVQNPSCNGTFYTLSPLVQNLIL